MKTYINQNNFHGCSMHTGPNCYYTENKKLEMDKSEDDLINHYNIQNTILNYKKQWKTIYEQSKKTSYVESFNEINTYIEDYKKYIFSKNDSKQIPPSINLRLRLTFQSYDDITINGDIYAYPSKPIKFNTEYIYIELSDILSYRNQAEKEYQEEHPEYELKKYRKLLLKDIKTKKRFLQLIKI